MICVRTRTIRTFACLVASVLLALVGAQATTVEPSPVGNGFGFGFAYNPAHEVTLVGTVKQLVSHPAHGSPLGLHVFVTVNGKTIDAHVGMYLSRQLQESLQIGEPIQVVGVHANVHGKDMLLARQLTFGGRQVTVRNEHGFLVGPGFPRHRAEQNHNAKGDQQ